MQRGAASPLCSLQSRGRYFTYFCIFFPVWYNRAKIHLWLLRRWAASIWQEPPFVTHHSTASHHGHGGPMRAFHKTRTWSVILVSSLVALLLALSLPAIVLAEPDGPPSALGPASPVSPALAPLPPT